MCVSGYVPVTHTGRRKRASGARRLAGAESVTHTWRRFMSTSAVKIYTTFDSFDADQVIATLEYYDIPAVKRVKGSGQYVGIIVGRMTTHEIDVYVAEEAVEKAVDILTETGFLGETQEPDEEE